MTQRTTEYRKTKWERQRERVTRTETKIHKDTRARRDWETKRQRGKETKRQRDKERLKRHPIKGIKEQRDGEATRQKRQGDR